MMNERELEKDLNLDSRKLVALNAAAQLIVGMGDAGYDGAQVFLTFRICVLKCIEIIPRDMEGRRGMQDILLSNLRSELRLLEDRIMEQRMEEDGTDV